MRRAVMFIFLLLASSLFAEPAPGVKPRAKAADYPAVKNEQNYTLGAQQLSVKQVRKSFVSNIGKEYVVVEVGFYPKAETKISPRDFFLRATGDKLTIRPADPQVVAARINDQDQRGRDLDVYPVVGVEYSTGPGRNDPYYRTDHGGGWTTTTGVMVDVKDKRKDPKTSDADQKAMEAELTEKGLPEISTTKPVAGYLYFPVSPDKHVQYQLAYQTPEATLVLPLPVPAE